MPKPPHQRRTSPTSPAWRRVNRLMICGIATGALGITGAKFWPEIEKLHLLRVQTQSLEFREAQLRLTRDRLRDEFLRLRDDPEYLELVARDRLDLLRDGETIIRFVTPAPPPPRTP